MAVMTLSEAFDEIEVINRHLALKREFLLALALRPAILRDPLESAGGSPAIAAEEMRSLAALEEHRVAIRRAVRAVADSATITLGNQTRTIADWLEWRRKVAPGRRALLSALQSKIVSARSEASGWNYALTEGSPLPKNIDLIINAPEADLAQQSELLEEALGSLDGQLSLKGATLTIDIAPLSKFLTEREALLVEWQKRIKPDSSPDRSIPRDYKIPEEYDAYAGFGTRVIPDSLRGLARSLLAGGQKIQAIKLVREHTGWSLLDAKNAVEALQ